jgi:hypothetical protein
MVLPDAETAMRLLCNLLVGLPLLGILAGSVLLLFQDFLGMGAPREWEACMAVRDWLVVRTLNLEALTHASAWFCRLPLGALIVIISLASALVLIPLGTALYKMKNKD